MFKFIKRIKEIKKENICNHRFVYIGMYYDIEYIEYTEFTNRFDKITVYTKAICEKCGKEFNERTCVEKFNPVRIYNAELKDRIKELREMKIYSEIEMIVECREFWVILSEVKEQE